MTEPSNPRGDATDRDRAPVDTAPRHRNVALALQGGGSHGAFTWGVLDRVLEEPSINIIGVTGTSAGAMNAVVLVDGLLKGGPNQARIGLRRLWEVIGSLPGLGAFFWPMSGESAAMIRFEETPIYLALEILSLISSPYYLNPFNYNPMRAPLRELIDFDRLGKQEDIQAVICATNARHARRRIFTNKDISLDAVLASACTPQLLPAVEIDGDPYWDGGFTANPAFYPLLQKMVDCDLIIVRVDPIQRKEAPRTMHQIFDRTVEISFNSTFWLELSALALVLKAEEKGLFHPARSRRILFHAIEASEVIEKFSAASKIINYAPLLRFFFDLGRQTADAWFTHNRAAIGHQSTVDLEQLLPPDF